MSGITNSGSRILLHTQRQLSRQVHKAVWNEKEDGIVLVDGVRTPFLKGWTDFMKSNIYDLQKYAFQGLMNKTGVRKEQIQYICVGNHFQDIQTLNLAKEAAICAGFPATIPAHTVTMACISSVQALTTCISYLQNDSADLCIAGGTEYVSDVQVRYGRKMRAILMESFFAKSLKNKISPFLRMKPKYLLPQIPSATEFTTNESMGEFSERLATTFKISRKEQDEFSARSHDLAERAYNDGNLSDIIPVRVPEEDRFIKKDNGIRSTSVEALSKLTPSFCKDHGSVTAGNASFFSDGASACLICTEKKAKELGLKPKAYIRNFAYTSASSEDQLLLGPTHSIPKVLQKSGLRLTDIDVWEIHEAFASQVLANLKALDSDYFCKNHTHFGKKFGEIPMEKINIWGGSLSLGHPFGATGVRLVMHAANRLIKEDKQIACLSACAAGGLGTGVILERHPDSPRL